MEKTEGLFWGMDNSEKISMNGKKRCMGCMEEYGKDFDLCPHCGYAENQDVENALHMYPNSILSGRYVVGRVLGYGGFGITYIAWDTTLQRKVAIKEYLPSEFATRSLGQAKVTVFSGNKSIQFNDGKEKFIEEAKRLAKFKRNNGIVQVFDAFEENNTAYIVMEYLDGETLSSFLEREGKIETEKAIEMMQPVIEALNDVNAEGIIHRDIAPDNIFLTKDGKVKLIDFGAARYATTSRSRSLTVIIKPGFSAEEQYRSGGDQGPHTDVYSVGATLYKMITGETPPDAFERRAAYEQGKGDILFPITKYTKEISKNQENAIMNALNIRIEDRTPDMINLAGELQSEEPVKRRSGKIKKIDVLTWPLWAKIGLPAVLAVVIVLSVLVTTGVIGPKAIDGSYNIPEGYAMVPNIVSKKIKDAEKKLFDRDLKILIKDKTDSKIIPEDMIMLQDPDALNVVPKGTLIGVTMSSGAPSAFVPDVQGLTEEYAKQQLEELGFVVEVEYKDSKDTAKGAVISQSEDAGSKYEQGKTITLVISTGDDSIDTSVTYTMENIVGMNIEEAEALLKTKELSIAIGENVYSSDIPKGKILSQDPPQGETAHAGDSIVVKISAGPKMVYIPDVTNMKKDRAYQTIKDAGLEVKEAYAESKTVMAGSVIKQDLQEGKEVKEGTTVTITISTGYSVSVPNVVGSKYNKAESALVEAGLAVKIEYSSSSAMDKDYVISQNPKSGTKTALGSTVVITVSKSEKTTTTTRTTTTRPTTTKPTTTTTTTKPTSGTIVASGKCGDNATYTLDKNGKLLISGSGKMYSWSAVGCDDFMNVDWERAVPWDGVRQQILSVEIASGITSIGRDAFFCCSNLKSVTIYNSVTSVEDWAFYDCENLTNITIPNSVTSIGYAAFRDCHSLTTIAIPDSVTSIGEDAFNRCDSLISISVDASNRYYSSDRYGVLYNKDKTELIRYPVCNAKKSFSIPNSVTSVEAYAFSGCGALTSITIPSSVTNIGEGAFWGCNGLTNIIIPSSVISIGASAFGDCFRLTKATINNGVTNIGDWAFDGCERLTIVTIPNSITSIGYHVFGECVGLTNVTIPNSVKSIECYAFYDCNNLKDVYYKGSKTQWEAVSIDYSGNDKLKSATIHYNS